MTTPCYRLAGPAEARLRAVLAESEARFGPLARDRYATLILRAMRDIAADPFRHNTHAEPALDPAVRFYHLRHSRSRAAPPNARVGDPRHLLVFQIAPDGVVEILGLIPDSVPRALAWRRAAGAPD